MDNFTPVAAGAGGVLIGIAATFLMALNGRVAGISGITAGLLSWRDPAPDWAWRLAFVIGIVLTPPILSASGLLVPPITFVVPLPAMVIAGILVGFGTVTGNGCTSGHGVCGIARLSMRSMVATAVFMVAGMATVFVMRHILAGG